jgi:uncharacterized protein GlcG (DUF336 family)
LMAGGRGSSVIGLKVRAVAVAALYSIGFASFAQAPPADKPASARSLPSDELPPFGMLDDNGKLIPVPDFPLGLPHAASAASQPPSARPRPAVPGPSMNIAIEGARAAIDACTALGATVAIAVVDSRGRPRALLMAPGSAGSVFVAMRKATATLAFGIPSSQIAARLVKEPALLSRFTPVMFLSGGALPIRDHDRMIGAIASSGAHGAGPIGAQDEVCARAGLEKINERLAANGG